MTGSRQRPLGLLFDVGGVCVVSPFQAILDYEIAHNIPPGWVNFSISRTSPNGSWHRLERGEMKMDADFFAEFNRDLRNPDLWRLFNEGLQKKKKKKNNNNNNDDDDDNDKDAIASTSLPPLPEVDAEYLFWEMMRISRTPDPFMFPALKKLKESGKFILGALSNTVIFPDGHQYNQDTLGRTTLFDFFISSAHSGLRKPDPQIYQVALEEMNAVARKKGLKQAVRASDVVFLDDIGQNLKPAKSIGMRTIKVNLGHIEDAVKELEKVTGLQLLEGQDKARL